MSANRQSPKRQLDPFDHLLVNFDKAVRSLSPNTRPVHSPSPASTVDEAADLSEQERKHAAALMRVNHTGEVMAQALYQGQALTARLPGVRLQMERAAEEELDHLAWCEERVRQLDSHTSLLNPVWYGLSFGMGAVAGLVSDKHSLGLVSAIEDQVCEHLEGHLETLPEQDKKSRAIVSRMLEDEARHSEQALDAGGKVFPEPVKKGMMLLSRLMTKTSYRI